MERQTKDSYQSAQDLIEWIRDHLSARLDSGFADQQACFPPHIILDLGNQGFFGMHVSTKYGGLALKTSDLLRVIEQIGAMDLTLATLVIEGVQGAHTLENYATDEFKSYYLPKLASGRIFVAGAMTESAAGSNPRAMQATAVPDDEDSWLLTGSKRWVGMGAWADVIAVYVQQLDEQGHWLGMSGFLVPQGSPGLEIGPLAQTMGIRAIQKHSLQLDSVKVAAKQLLGELGQGMEIAQDNMMYVRLCLAAANIGVMKRSAQLMYRYAKRRTIATGRLLDNPVTLITLSELTASIDAMQHFVKLAAQLHDESPEKLPEEVLVAAKVLGSEFAGWAVDKLVQILGARGYEEASGVSQLFRDTRTFRIFEGPTEALTMYIGSRMLSVNFDFKHFFCHVLQQSDLFDEIELLIKRITDFSVKNKQQLFTQKFATSYLIQSLTGEMVSYGLLLGVVNSQSQVEKRTQQWAREKFDSVVEKTLKVSAAEKVLLQPDNLQCLVSSYINDIGDINPVAISKEVGLDQLLQKDDNLHISIADECKAIIDLDICPHALFEQQAEQQPDATALIYYQQSLSYKELNSQANQLAHYLREIGVTGETAVGIYIERSPNMIIAVLAVLKAGGTYVPLDQCYPKERLKFMVDDADVQIVLTQKAFAECPLLQNRQAVFLDELTELIAGKSDKNLTINQATQSLAYILYTSGSTGTPKGVMLSHQSLTNLIQYHQYKIGEKRNVLQYTTPCFDMSFLEIFAALTGGGALTLISEQDRLNLYNFSRIVKEHKVQQLILNVPFLTKLAERKIDISHFASLKEVIVAGEQLIATPDIQRFFNQLTDCRLLNYYGPSETHVIMMYQLPDDVKDWPKHIPIGKKITHTHVLILDEELQPVPLGETGELYIGGVSLARGYKNMPGITQEKFITDQNSGLRLFRTGDFAKCLSNGDVVFQGRKDEQVKISGYRVELQEIEIQLAQHPAIESIAVITKKDNQENTCLEAYFVKATDSTDDDVIASLRKLLKERLPYYMMPCAFYSITEMPLTPSGKIDRFALKKINTHSTVSMKTEKIEQGLLGILKQFFQYHVDINDNFVAMGGNSLLAMSIASQIYDEFRVEIPAYLILSTSTILEVANKICALKRA